MKRKYSSKHIKILAFSLEKITFSDFPLKNRNSAPEHPKNAQDKCLPFLQNIHPCMEMAWNSNFYFCLEQNFQNSTFWKNLDSTFKLYNPCIFLLASLFYLSKFKRFIVPSVVVSFHILTAKCEGQNVSGKMFTNGFDSCPRYQISHLSSPIPLL